MGVMRLSVQAGQIMDETKPHQELLWQLSPWWLERRAELCFPAWGSSAGRACACVCRSPNLRGLARGSGAGGITFATGLQFQSLGLPNYYASQACGELWSSAAALLNLFPL